MTGGFAAAALLCFAYYLVIAVYAGITADFAWIWIVFALGLGIISLICGIHNRQPELAWASLARRILLTVFGAGMAALLILSGLVVSGMGKKGEKGLPYVIVLGAQVKGTRPSRALRLRLEAALSYAQENPETTLILSGGKGSGEEISEAECMRGWLEEAGIPAKRLILEDQSTSTEENLKFSQKWIQDAPVGIVTNNFHVYRAEKLAKRLGYTQAVGIAGASDPILQVHYVVREAAALVKMAI